MVQRGGAVILHLLANVQQATIKPLILAGVALGSLINTDEYTIYGRLPQWGFGHKTVNHGRGEYARDEDGDGFCEVHVNTMEILCWLSMEKSLSIIVRVLASVPDRRRPSSRARQGARPRWGKGLTGPSLARQGLSMRSTAGHEPVAPD